MVARKSYGVTLITGLKMFDDIQSRLTHFVSRTIGLAADARLPNRLLRAATKAYSAGYGVNTDEAIEPRGGYESFGGFFARPLKPNVRPICEDSHSIVSSADGEIVDFGPIENGFEPSITVKGAVYSVNQLLGVDKIGTRQFEGGGFVMIYLHPRDYHRVHVPADAVLAEVRHIPGSRFSVAPWSTSRVRGVYSRNERMVFEFHLENHGKLVVAMIAALGVGNIQTEYSPVVSSASVSKRILEPKEALHKGEELGVFRLGSTVVMFWTKETVKRDEKVSIGPIRMGQRIGWLLEETRSHGI